MCGGVAHRHARQEAELHALPRHRIGAGDHRLAGDHRRHRRQHRPSAAAATAGASRKNGLSTASGCADHQRALAEIVQHQAGQHEERPAQPDRVRAEMAHVGIQRLGAGDAQHHGAEHDERQHLVLHAQRDRVAAAKSPAARTGAARSRPAPSSADDDEPHRHDRAEHPADAAGAAPLHGEQHHDHRRR